MQKIRFIIVFIVSCLAMFIAFSPTILLPFKLAAIFYAGFSVSFLIIETFFRVLLKLIMEIVDLLNSLASVVVIDPELVKKLDKDNKYLSMAKNITKNTNFELTDIVKTLSKKVADIEKNLHPFRISLYSIFVGVSVGVAAIVVAIVIQRILPSR